MNILFIISFPPALLLHNFPNLMSSLSWSVRKHTEKLFRFSLLTHFVCWIVYFPTIYDNEKKEEGKQYSMQSKYLNVFQQRNMQRKSDFSVGFFGLLVNVNRNYNVNNFWRTCKSVSLCLNEFEHRYCGLVSLLRS